jgi:ATP-dependent RNA helicase DDX52/ROK1
LISRGIDFKKVNLVINYDFPNTAINYIHRCGRTGRNNQKGTAVTFFTDLDKPLLKTIGNLLSSSGCEVPDWVL